MVQRLSCLPCAGFSACSSLCVAATGAADTAAELSARVCALATAAAGVAGTLVLVPTSLAHEPPAPPLEEAAATAGALLEGDAPALVGDGRGLAFWS